MRNGGFTTKKALIKVSLAQMVSLVPLQRKMHIQYSGKSFETVTITRQILYKEERRFIMSEAAFGVTSFVHLC